MNDQIQIQKLCSFAQQYYYFVYRDYHNWGHAIQVADTAKMLTRFECDDIDAIQLAAYWHDAVYIPGAKKSANEICSAQLLQNGSKSFPEVSQKTVAAATYLIEHTSIEYHLSEDQFTSDLAILLDADLYNLSVPFHQFCSNQVLIIYENGGLLTRENCVKCAEFLKQFLTCREFIYHTDFMRQIREKLAKENIRKYIEMFL